MARLRFAFVGAGRIAADHFAELARREDVDVLAVCDHDPARAAALAPPAGDAKNASLTLELAPELTLRGASDGGGGEAAGIPTRLRVPSRASSRRCGRGIPRVFSARPRSGNEHSRSSAPAMRR